MDRDGLIAATEGLSVRERLHRVIDDMEMIIKQLGEVATIARDDRGAAKDVNVVELTKLFKIKEEELEKTLKIAAEQAERQKIIDNLEHEVKKRDEYLSKIQNCLRDAERLMTNAIFQANQKLKSIAMASNQKVSSEELIRYAYQISASNAVAAPLTWQQGDPQRPFPTDVEMRSGLMSRVPVTDLLPQAPMNVGQPQPWSRNAPSTTNEVFPGAPGLPAGSMMPPRNVPPAGWVAQRALTPPNVSPRALRLPPPPPFHPGMQQHTPPMAHYIGGPVSPASAAVSSPLSSMHLASTQQQQQQHPLMQSTPPTSFHQPPFSAKVLSPQMGQMGQQILSPPQQPVRTPQSQYRQTSPANARGAKEEPTGMTPQHSADPVELLSSDSSSSSSSDSPE